MRSSSFITLAFAALTMISLQTKAWDRDDHRTYHGPAVTERYQTYEPYRSYQNYGTHYHQTYRSFYPSYHESAPSVYWRAGYWQHEWHENRFGWWWVNGLAWSFYAAPIYTYPEQTQTNIIYEDAPQPAPQVIHVPSPAVNPVVATAPSGPVPGNQAPPQNSGLYYFCESSQLYYPYARTCSERWKAVSQQPAD